MGTKMLILKSCDGPHDEDMRELVVNWMRKEVKGMKFSQLSNFNFQSNELCFEFSVSTGVVNIRIGKMIPLKEL